MPATVHDIANAAGVSHTAVSAVLGGRARQARIGARTAERILAVAADLGYERNDLARAVASGRTRLIAMIAREPSREYIGHLLHGALAAADQRGYLLHLQSLADAAGHDLGAACARSRSYRPLGLYVCAVDQQPVGLPDREAMIRDRIPLLHSHCIAGLPGIAFDSDEAQGMALAVEHLRGLGHRRIAFLGGPAGQRSADERRAGFRTAMAQQRLPLPAGHDTGDGWDWEAAEPALRRLLTSDARPTAIICANDSLAVVAMQVATARGLSVPRDLSLVGCSDELIGRFVRPQPTTVVQPHREIGHAAVSAIIDVAEGLVDQDSLASRRLPTRLDVRGSTAPCPS